MKNAFIKYNKKKILDFKRNNLHLLGYSSPLKQKVSLDVLKKHLYTDKENQKAVPYVTSYYKRNWGFCVSKEFENKLKKGQYEININSSFKKNGKLTIGGYKADQKVTNANICHPSMANHEIVAIVTYF